MGESNNEFYTFRGYAMHSQDNRGLTPSKEDYLEMIYRLSHGKGYARINDLAGALNVQPPSATKMVQKLAEGNYLNYEKYGLIELTPVGLELGEQLLLRHQTLEEFLHLLGVTANILEDTEKIEHNLSVETLNCIFNFVRFMKDHPNWLKEFNEYQHQKQP